jgi:hypothetical protein
MVRALIVAVALATAVAPAMAQYGTLGVYSEPSGCNCNVYDTLPGNLVSVYVVHRGMVQGLQGVRFIVAGGGGMTMTYLAQSKVGPPLEITGNIVDGYNVSYGSCLTGNLLIMEIVYLGTATSATCSWLDVAAAPSSSTGQVEGWDCDGGVVTVGGERTPVNPDATCACEMPGCQPVPVEGTTWGGIKALYR